MTDQEVQDKYQQISSSNIGANAISSDMYFKNEAEANDKEGRYSTPANMPSFSEKLHDHWVARSSFGSGQNREAIK